MLNGAAPSFDLAEGGLLLAFVRSISVMAIFSAYGALLFRTLVAPHAFPKMRSDERALFDRQLHLLVRISLALNAVFLIIWLVFEASLMADAATLSGAFAAILPVASSTTFGWVIGMQMMGALATFIVLEVGPAEWRWRGAGLMAAVTSVLQAGHSHAVAMAPGFSLLLASDALHLLSAGAWLGALLPLILMVRAGSPRAGALAARYFSPLGKLCIYGLLISAAYQGWALLGGIPGLIGTAYGWVVAAKAALFGVLFGFAWVNRYRLAPALLEQDDIAAKRHLVRSIAAQTAAGGILVAVAAILSSLQPGLHTQPIWPFAKQFSLVTIQEDPAFRREVVGAVIALGVAGSMLAIGLAVPRFRWLFLGTTVVLIGLSVPHLELLFVEAYPTSFYHSPTGFAATAIADGASLYPPYCAACHGIEGRGDGPQAKSLDIPPADLTAPHLWDHPDGELFWWLTHGIDGPRAALAMPGSAAELSEKQRWDLIDYIRAHNAGSAFAGTGTWSPPVRAPDLTASCPGGINKTLYDLRGKVLRVIFAPPDGKPPLPPQDGVEIVAIVIMTGETSTKPPANACIASDPAVTVAYAAISGVSPGQLTGSEFLIDANGWLRVMRRAGEDSAKTADFLAQIDQICRNPVANRESDHAHHHHS